MGLWRDRALPRLTDVSLRGHHLGGLRDETCAGLHGRVLEIGFGSGLNVRFYPDAVDVVDAVEPADGGWRLSEERRARQARPINRTGLDGQHIEAEDSSYDAVLSTFTLCSIPDLDKALSEILRVLKPGGNLHFLEHGLSPEPRVAAWQRRLEPAQRVVAGGCHLTRQMPDLMTAAGLTVSDLRETYLPGPSWVRPWGYLYLGRAVAARNP
jgi:SAM-dependent methyltransferase